MNTIKKLLCALCAFVMVIGLMAGCAQEEKVPQIAQSATVTITVGDAEAVTKQVEYIYDEAGNLIKEIFTDAEGNQVKNFYIFNDENLCVNDILNNEDGTKDKHRFTYRDGILVKSAHTTPAGSVNNTEYSYDEAGVRTGYTLTYANKEVQTGVYTYNAEGQLVNLTCTGVNPCVIDYEYNDNGDLAKESVTVDGVVTVTAYEYTYVPVAE